MLVKYLLSEHHFICLYFVHLTESICTSIAGKSSNMKLWTVWQIKKFCYIVICPGRSRSDRSKDWPTTNIMSIKSIRLGTLIQPSKCLSTSEIPKACINNFLNFIKSSLVVNCQLFAIECVFIGIRKGAVWKWDAYGDKKLDWSSMLGVRAL